MNSPGSPKYLPVTMIIEEPDYNDNMLGNVEEMGIMKEKLKPFELEDSHHQRLHSEGKIRRPSKSFVSFDQAKRRGTFFIVFIICTIALGILILITHSKRPKNQKQELQTPVSDYQNTYIVRESFKLTGYLQSPHFDLIQVMDHACEYGLRYKRHILLDKFWTKQVQTNLDVKMLQGSCPVNFRMKETKSTKKISPDDICNMHLDYENDNGIKHVLNQIRRPHTKSLNIIPSYKIREDVEFWMSNHLSSRIQVALLPLANTHNTKIIDALRNIGITAGSVNIIQPESIPKKWTEFHHAWLLAQMDILFYEPESYLADTIRLWHQQMRPNGKQIPMMKKQITTILGGNSLIKQKS